MEKKDPLPFGIGWVIKNKIGLLMGFFSLFCISYYFFRDQDQQSYYQIEQSLALWKKTKKQKHLEGFLVEWKKNPQCKIKHQEIILENCLTNKDFTLLNKEMQGSAYYLDKVFPLHKKYSATSLLIEEGKVKQALQESIALQELLNKAKAKNCFLAQWNLLRIALLCKNLDQHEDELATYEKILDKQIPLSEKGLSFSDYIAERKIKLRS